MRLLMLLACAAALPGQTFEVASVKPVHPDQRAVDFVLKPGGYLQITNCSLAEIIREAYGLKYWQLSGAPGWLDSERFNIEARAGREVTRPEAMAMLRALLAERCKLQARRETREGNVYELIVAKGGPKLKPSTAEKSHLWLMRNTPPTLPGVSYTKDAQKISMTKFADDLTSQMQRPVLDRTGVEGEFDFKVDYAIDGHPEEGPSIYTALQEQLGLKLQPAKGPVEMLVIERVERPAAN